MNSTTTHCTGSARAIDARTPFYRECRTIIAQPRGADTARNCAGCSSERCGGGARACAVLCGAGLAARCMRLGCNRGTRSAPDDAAPRGDAESANPLQGSPTRQLRGSGVAERRGTDDALEISSARPQFEKVRMERSWMLGRAFASGTSELELAFCNLNLHGSRGRRRARRGIDARVVHSGRRPGRPVGQYPTPRHVMRRQSDVEHTQLSRLTCRRART